MNLLLPLILIFSVPSGAATFQKKLQKRCRKDFTAAWMLQQSGAKTTGCLLRDPNKRISRLTLNAHARLRQGKYKEGVKMLTPLLKSKRSLPLLRTVAGQLYWHLGKKDKAGGLFDRVIDDYKRGFSGKDPWDLTAAGIASIWKRDWETAEEIFVKIDKKHGSFVPGLIAAGEYDRLIEFYQRSKRLLKKAVTLAPFYPPALVGYGRVLFQNPYGEKTGKASELAKQALAIHAGRYEANLLLAKIALNDLDYAVVEKNLATVEKRVKNVPLTMTIRAGVALLKEQTGQFMAIEKRILATYPLYFDHYYQLGRILNRHHRYRLAAREFKKGLLIAPENVPLLAWLGLSLLRIGEEGKGYYYLKKAAELNEDHVMAYNVMTLYQDIIFPKYIAVRKGPFLYRVPKKEWPVMKAIVPPVLEAAFSRYQKHYGYTPPLPVKIEFFKDKKDFMVLIAGHPVESGILGVCFGQVISFLSPSSGRANWAMVISHELAHTFHVELTKGKVPRWFTEGLAEFETANANYYWKREMSRRIHTAHKYKKLRTVSEVNKSFTHARSSLEMVTAYIHSTWLVRFLYLKAGWKGITLAMKRFRSGGDTRAAIKAATGLTDVQFDKAFSIYIDLALKRYGGQFAPMAVNHFTTEELERLYSMQHKEAACMLALKYTLWRMAAKASEWTRKCQAAKKQSPWVQYIDVISKLRKRDTKGAISLLSAMSKGAGDGYDTRELLATLYKRQNNEKEELTHLLMAHRYDPEALGPLRRLSMIYNQKKDDAATLYWLKTYARFAESDASASHKIVEIAWRIRDYSTVAEFGNLLLQISPFSAGEYNYRTGYSMIKTGNSAMALYPLLVYRTLNPSDRLGRVRLLLAKAYIAHGRYKEARKLLAVLTKLFPGMFEAAKLLTSIKGK